MAVTVPKPAPDQAIDVRPGDLVAVPEPSERAEDLLVLTDLDQHAIATEVGYSSNPDRTKEMAMQVLWMVLVTMGLALGGVLGLALVSHLAARARHR